MTLQLEEVGVLLGSHGLFSGDGSAVVTDFSIIYFYLAHN